MLYLHKKRSLVQKCTYWTTKPPAIRWLKKTTIPTHWHQCSLTFCLPLSRLLAFVIDRFAVTMHRRSSFETRTIQNGSLCSQSVQVSFLPEPGSIIIGPWMPVDREKSGFAPLFWFYHHTFPVILFSLINKHSPSRHHRYFWRRVKIYMITWGSVAWSLFDGDKKKVGLHDSNFASSVFIFSLCAWTAHTIAHLS
jgi:hypothetical protein